MACALGYRYLNLGTVPAAAILDGVAIPLRARHALASNDIRIGLIWAIGESPLPAWMPGWGLRLAGSVDRVVGIHLINTARVTLCHGR